MFGTRHAECAALPLGASPSTFGRTQRRPAVSSSQTSLKSSVCWYAIVELGPGAVPPKIRRLSSSSMSVAEWPALAAGGLISTSSGAAPPSAPVASVPSASGSLWIGAFGGATCPQNSPCQKQRTQL